MSLSSGRFIPLLLCALLIVLAVPMIGCKQGDEPIERTADKGWDAIKQWQDKAQTELSTRTAQWQGGIQGINPLYRSRGMGGMFTGFIWDATLGVEGMAGQLQAASQADQGEALPDTRPPGSRAPAAVGNQDANKQDLGPAPGSQ
jgi:hypothetical protein